MEVWANTGTLILRSLIWALLLKEAAIFQPQYWDLKGGSEVGFAPCLDYTGLCYHCDCDEWSSSTGDWD